MPFLHSSCDSQYIGRFAPSPSGPLHMGSLMCALASYLDAKHNLGKWLLRIEDIDPPREPSGASKAIQKSLASHGLHWDDDITFQSNHSERYADALNTLRNANFLYQCTCTRKRLASIPVGYDGNCRSLKYEIDTPSSTRLNIESACKHNSLTPLICVNDKVQQQTKEDLSHAGDFIIHRKDGLFAYQLAVVVDDINQGITHIVRGSDLYDCTGKQVFLTQLLNGTAIEYAHIPVLCTHNGNKLSKQNHAPGIEDSNASQNIFCALKYLLQSPPPELNGGPIEAILSWAIQNWNINKLSRREKVLL